MSGTMDQVERQRAYDRACRERKRLGVAARPPAIERLLSQVDMHGPVPEHFPELGPCWVYTGYIHPSGYARVYDNSRGQQAHTYVYERLIGPIPEGLEPDHRCLNKACVRPSHLEPVTHQENCRRGHRRPLTVCRNGHPYDEQNTGYSNSAVKGRVRYCKACSREATAAHRRRRAAA